MAARWTSSTGTTGPAGRGATGAIGAAGGGTRPARHPVFRERPTVIGHRGNGAGQVGGHLENTLESFAAALDAGTAWVELDVRRTADDDLAVVHNPADAGGAYVIERTMAELTALGIPSLRQVLDALPVHIGLDVDLKSSLEDAVLPAQRSTAALVAPVLDEERQRRELLVTSFDPAALLVLRERAPLVPLGLLTWFTFPLHMAVAAAAHLGVEVIAAQVGSFRPDGHTVRHRGAAHAVDVAHAAGLEVIAWCPSPTEAAELVEAGVDALVVDGAPPTDGQAPAGPQTRSTT